MSVVRNETDRSDYPWELSLFWTTVHCLNNEIYPKELKRNLKDLTVKPKFPQGKTKIAFTRGGTFMHEPWTPQRIRLTQRYPLVLEKVKVPG